MAEALLTASDYDGTPLVSAWRPMSKPQEAYVACPVFEIFYGGSRGSLKTDGSLGDWLRHESLYGKHAVGLMVRRKRTQLVETYARAKEIFQPLGFRFTDAGHSAMTCVSPRGARLRFAYLEHDSDAEEYQGHSYTRVYVEELGNFPDPAPVFKLMATLRSPHGVPCGFRGTGNPGGPGHGWVKTRYIDPAPQGWKLIPEEFVNPWTKLKTTRERIFIPGKITDHNLLGDQYITNLQMSGSPELVRAWLEGDWDVVAGAFFPEFSRGRHVLSQMQIPANWKRFTSTDWGSSRPFWTGWFGVAQSEMKAMTADMRPTVILPGALVVYREWYGYDPKQQGTNIGLKMAAEDWAAGVLSRTYELGSAVPTEYDTVDTSMFDEDGGPSLAERAGKVMHKGKQKLRLRPSDKRRLPGWNQIRYRLKGDGDDQPPMLFILESCKHLIRTLAALQHDELDIEDADTEGEDHAPDGLRYGCMSRPRQHPALDAEDAGPAPGTMDWLVGEAWKKNRALPKRSSYRLE